MQFKNCLTWVYELNSYYQSVKKLYCLEILEDRRNYKHDVLGFIFFLRV